MVVADTHTLVWWAGTPEKLSAAGRAALEGERVAFAAITCMEIAVLVRRNRIELAVPVDEWLDAVLALPSVTLLPLNREIAVLAGQFNDDLVRDPSDRIIVATAIHHGLPLVTADHKIAASGLVRTIW
ncbi:MAG TPA: type II toxin-antitoxin system VapC family toxin [Thermoanaerobaculia bacterium]|nr:type II toxin-antitoxin system VapC family toxin [Thermoanaerobaculia bacterium]